MEFEVQYLMVLSPPTKIFIMHEPSSLLLKTFQGCILLLLLGFTIMGGSQGHRHFADI